jgi:hypothetical protein
MGELDLGTTPVELEGPLAQLALRFGLDGEQMPGFSFAPLVRGTWGDVDFNGFDGAFTIAGSRVEVRLQTRESPSDRDMVSFRKLRGSSESPITLTLLDGSEIVADCGHLRSWGAAFDEGEISAEAMVSLSGWRHGDRSKARVWAGRIDGVVFNVGNLKLAERRGKAVKIRTENLRLAGSYVWNLIHTKEGHVALIEPGAEPLDGVKLASDFRALEFVLGAPLRLETLLGLDEGGGVVAAMGVELGYRRIRGRGVANGPVPDRFRSNERWVPVLFELLAKTIEAQEPEPLLMALAAYVDAQVDAHEGSALKTQVVLEAFCGHLLANAKTRHLVGDTADWMKWVDGHAREITEHARDREASRKLLRRVKSAMHPPASDVIADALAHLGLVVPADLLLDVQERNTAAHRFLMQQAGGSRNDSARINRKVDVVLAAIVCRYAGYEGPLAGWERDAAGARVDLSWWPEARNRAPSRRTYYAQRVVVEERDETEDEPTTTALDATAAAKAK